MNARTIRPVFLLIAALWLPFSAAAQMTFGVSSSGKYPASVEARVYPSVALTSETVRIDVTVQVDKGNYMYALDPVGDGPVPTSLSAEIEGLLEPVAGSEWTPKPAPKKKFDRGFQTNVFYHAGEVTFSREYRVIGQTPGDYEISGNIRMQICDDVSCLPPRRNPWKFDLMVRNPNAPEQTEKAVEAPAGAQTPAPEAGESAEEEQSADAGEEASVIVAVDESDSADAEEGSDTTVAATTEDPEAAEDVAKTAAAIASQKADLPREPVSYQSETVALAEKSLGGIAIVALLAGLATLLTPCVFPMIPITISFFTKRASQSTPQRVGLCTVYSGSIILGFAILGFGLAILLKVMGFGTERAGTITQIAANPVLNILLAGLFLAFAASLFGMFDIALPSSWANKLQQKQSGRKDAFGAFLMAMVFVIVSFTCTAPIVGPLILLSFEGHWTKPLVGLTMYGVGFAVPFFILGLVPGLIQALPKSGGWLNATKVTMGLIEVAAAMKFLSNADLVRGWGIFTREFVLATWVAISAIITLYLLNSFRMSKDGEVDAIGPMRLSFGVVFGSIAFYLAYGLFGGSLHANVESFLPPQQQNVAAAAPATNTMEQTAENAEGPKMIMNDFARAQEIARKENKPLFVDFTGWTCTNCRLNEIKVFPKPEVKQLMNQYVKVALYTDDKEVGERYQKLQSERFGTFSLPFYVLLSPDDETIATYGGLIRDTSEFVQFLEYGLENAGTKIAAN